MSTPVKIFDNLELVRCICQLSEDSDQVHLLCVSKPIFNVAVSVVWESIKGVHHLISLLPGVKCQPRENYPNAKIIVSKYTNQRNSRVYFTQSIPQGPLSLERFALYAPFVRFLEIYDGDTERYWIPNWSGFMTYARNKTMLPNLKTLTLTATSAHNNQLMWIRSFLSPSLVEIRVIPSNNYTPFLSYLGASTMFRYITDFCPNLQNLSLFPNSEDPNAHREAPHDPQSMINFWDSVLPWYLERAQTLRRLTTTTEVLMPENVGHLGDLPHLERLSISPAARALLVDKPAPENAFPALRTFSLRSAPHSLFDDVDRLGFFKCLTTLKLEFTTRPTSKPEAISWARKLVSLICNGSPHLADLTIDFDLNNTLGLLSIDSEALLAPMKTVPLQELCIIEADLGKQGNIHKTMPIVWAQLTVLTLPDERGSPEELYWFSQLPCLTHLVLNLDLFVPGSDLNYVGNPVNHCLDTLESHKKIQIVGDLTHIARYGLTSM
jgi:hypothetical protein